MMDALLLVLVVGTVVIALLIDLAVTIVWLRDQIAPRALVFLSATEVLP